MSDLLSETPTNRLLNDEVHMILADKKGAYETPLICRPICISLCSIDIPVFRTSNDSAHIQNKTRIYFQHKN